MSRLPARLRPGAPGPHKLLGGPLGRALLHTAVVVAVLGACRGSQAVGPAGQATRTVDPGRVDPAFQGEWDAVQAAHEKDPSGPAVVEAADRLLARDPPLNLRLAAHQLKANANLERGDYAAALASARAGLDDAAKVRAQGTDLAPPERELAEDLGRTRALAEAEVGDPQAALQAIAAATRGDRGPDLLAATARARERLGDRAGAALAYAQWREVVQDGSAAAALAEARMREQWRGLDATALEDAARKAAGTAAAQCLLVRAGRSAPAGAPAWVSGCQVASTSGPPRIGLLLPRSGKFAGLADVQLAAATAAVRVLAGPAGSSLQVAWEDAGSSPAEAKQAAAALLASGASVLVGPVGPGNVEAAAEVAAASGGRARLVVPGEGAGQVVGVAPTLEARAAALAQAVGRANRTTAVILAPDNAYGKRAVAAFEKSLPKMGVKSLKSIYYPPNTTSFSKVLEPVRSSLKSAAVLIPDQLGRVELVVRQMVRDGVVIDRPKQPGVPVLSTAEGCSPEAIGAGHEVLEGVLVAPVGWETPEAAGFTEAYTAMEGSGPPDQAWLVYRAVAQAWAGAEAAPPPAAAVLRVESGRFVATESAVSLTPAERPQGR
ncbi:penicillin-binding protein activator [Nannocystis sp. ILAH1]|uniref:penicillin-binding protein activator n=1 Tax=unclassified Nannocystis TaxID=2627009 RepID=UPI00226F5030|nr:MULTISPECIES: ABC transporter substrate-binding protein [unclassified Nannocystis]MCY0990328.1 penicillin-binding protein activator [Nannocystis sp. ILAH1]MCY1069383.1 penicillin-binding protein activator [Nannocystis sp. RBIL2]